MDFEKQEHTAGLELVEHSGGDYLSPWNVLDDMSAV